MFQTSLPILLPRGQGGGLTEKKVTMGTILTLAIWILGPEPIPSSFPAYSLSLSLCHFPFLSFSLSHSLSYFCYLLPPPFSLTHSLAVPNTKTEAAFLFSTETSTLTYQVEKACTSDEHVCQSVSDPNDQTKQNHDYNRQLVSLMGKFKTDDEEEERKKGRNSPL